MNKLQGVKAGDEVWCGSDNFLADPQFEKVERVTTRICDMTKEEYPVIWLEGNHRFDGRTGDAINNPLGFYIVKF